MSEYKDGLNIVQMIISDPSAFKDGHPQWKSMEELDLYLRNHIFRLTTAERMGPIDKPNGQQLIYLGPANVIVKIKTNGYNDDGHPRRVGVPTMSIEVTDGKGTGWDNALFKVSGKGKILAKNITTIDQEVLKTPKGDWGLWNKKEGKVVPFTKFEVIEGGGGKVGTQPINKQAWADASHLNLPKGFSPKGADDLAAKINGNRPPVPKVTVKATPPAKVAPANDNRPTTAGRGNAVEPMREHVSTQSFHRQALDMALRGINNIIQGINDKIQQERANEQMKKFLPTIEQTLEKNPTQGVLIAVVYYKREKVTSENDSPMDHTKGFSHIRFNFGNTREAARQVMRSTPRMDPAGMGSPISTEEWIPPKQEPKARELKLPFPTKALATFVKGSEELTKVKFSHIGGFDDTMFSVLSLDSTATFYVMSPPSEVNYFFGKWRKEYLDIGSENPGAISDHEQSGYQIATILLDSSWNPNSASVAMIYPANDSTLQLFKRKGGRIDDSGLLSAYSMDFVRFVKPHKIHIIETYDGMTHQTPREETSLRGSTIESVGKRG